MTKSMMEQDVVIYLVLIAVVWMYRSQMARSPVHQIRRHLSKVWTWWGHGMATYLVGVGMLYQGGIVPRLVAYALFVIGIVAVFLCLRALRRSLRQSHPAETGMESK